MDLIAILSTVILLVTVGTITVALAAYAAVKVRDKRKPKQGPASSTDNQGGFQPEFLRRYMPPDKTEAVTSGSNPTGRSRQSNSKS
jgi:hypothetical protein